MNIHDLSICIFSISPSSDFCLGKFYLQADNNLFLGRQVSLFSVLITTGFSCFSSQFLEIILAWKLLFYKLLILISIVFSFSVKIQYHSSYLWVSFVLSQKFISKFSIIETFFYFFPGIKLHLQKFFSNFRLFHLEQQIPMYKNQNFQKAYLASFLKTGCLVYAFCLVTLSSFRNLFFLNFPIFPKPIFPISSRTHRIFQHSNY